MAFMKDDTTTSITGVFCTTWAQLILPDKGVDLLGSLFFVRLNGDTHVSLNTFDQKEENIP